MPERLQLPPPDQLVPELPTPDHTHTYMREVVSRESPRFQALNPIKRGTLYSSCIGGDQRIVDAYPTLFFLRQTVPIGSNTIAGMTQDGLVIWEWATAPDAESATNSEIGYKFESVNYPIFTRVYAIKRAVYEASPTIAINTALTALLGVKITSGGTGYTTATAVFGVAGSGATVEFVIAGGAIIGAIVTKEGTGFTSGSTITISGDGSGATATCIIQPDTAQLVEQKKEEFPEDHPLRNEFVKVIRVYEILPGPILYGQEFNRKFGVPIPYTIQEIAHGTQLGTDADIKPLSTVKAEKRSTNTDLLAHILATVVTITPDSVNLDLPDVLTAITTYYEKGEGVGISSASNSGSGSGNTWFYKSESSSDASGSASIIPEVVPTILTYPARNLRSARYAFFLIKQPSQALLDSAILAKLTALVGSVVTAFPQFRPEPVTLILKGQKKSVRGSTNSSISASHNADGGSASSTGSGSSISKDVSNSIRAKFISPTIHAALTISSATDSESASSTGGGSVTANASVAPTSIAATNITAIPTSGKCLLRARAELFEPNIFMVDAEVFDWANVIA